MTPQYADPPEYAMETLRFYEGQARVVNVDGRTVLFHVPTTSLFDLDFVGNEVLSFCKGQEQVTASDIQARFDGQFDPTDVTETLQEFLNPETNCVNEYIHLPHPHQRQRLTGNGGDMIRRQL